MGARGGAGKRELRGRIRAARRGRSAGERAAARDGLAAGGLALVLALLRESAGGAGTGAVAAYRPIPGEPDVSGLVDGLKRAGVTVYLPVAVPGHALEWARDDGEYAPSAAAGGEEPTGARIGTAQLLGVVGLVLVPALAVDAEGLRLGQGGGFYDRSFGPGERPGPPLWAVVHAGELLAPGEIPAEPHDLRVDAALLPDHLVPARRA